MKEILIDCVGSFVKEYFRFDYLCLDIFYVFVWNVLKWGIGFCYWIENIVVLIESCIVYCVCYCLGC